MIVLVAFLFLIIALLALALFFTVRSNFALQEQIAEYEGFFVAIYQVLESDIDFLRGVLARKMSLNIPEVQEFASGLTHLQNHIAAIKSNIKFMQMLQSIQLEEQERQTFERASELKKNG